MIKSWKIDLIDSTVQKQFLVFVYFFWGYGKKAFQKRYAPTAFFLNSFVKDIFKNIVRFYSSFILRPSIFFEIMELTRPYILSRPCAKFILKNYIFKMFKFLFAFFIDIITPVISSTQIAFDVMCVQHVIH